MNIPTLWEAVWRTVATTYQYSSVLSDRFVHGSVIGGGTHHGSSAKQDCDPTTYTVREVRSEGQPDQRANVLNGI